MDNNLATTNSQDLINQIKALAGNMGGSFVPFIPIISINNKEQERDTEIDGKLTKVKVPAQAGFNITIKNEQSGNYEQSFYREKLEAVMLRTRYSIKSKHKVIPKYYSYEFDNFFTEIIPVYGENKEIIMEGDYASIKKRFATGEMNSMGKPKTSFDLRVVVYIDIDGQIYRFKINSASRSNYFDYIKTFGNNDVPSAYKTKFNLKFNDQGSIKFWYAEFERGEAVDLNKEIPLLKELQKYFNADKAIKHKEIVDTFEQADFPDEAIQIDADMQVPF